MVMQYNLTVAYTVRGELDKASDTLKQVRRTVSFLHGSFYKLIFLFQLNHAKGQGMDIPIQAMMLALYIQMQLGK